MFLFSKKLQSFSKEDKILIIAPHPDDEIFGCGNLIYTLHQNHINYRILILSKGEKSCKIDETILKEERMKNAYLSYELLTKTNNHTHKNATPITFLDFPDANFKSLTLESPQVTRLSEYIKTFNPNIIYCPHPYEKSIDHKYATSLIEKITNNKNIQIYYYCVWLFEDIPWKEILNIPLKNIFHITPNHNYKKESCQLYINRSGSNKVIYSGQLPRLFTYISKQKTEFFIKKA